MIPRPASEQLVAAAVARIGADAARVADVGTGCGAIAVAIAKRCVRARVWATDTNRDAVALARANARRHAVEPRVCVCRGDMLAPAPGLFDVIVANLPYIAAATAADHPEVHAEPFSAVFVAGDGLDPYRRLVDAAATRLTSEGVLFLQLHRRVVAAGRAELGALAASLDKPRRAFTDTERPAPFAQLAA